jgi:multicomponent Na+:H+ antiporter subunit G
MVAVEAAVVALLVAAGVFFAAVAAVGLVRLPDLYSRTHAASKSETLGATLALAGVAVAIGPDPAVLKVGLLLVFVFLTAPTAAHAVARAAHEEGHRPWRRDRESRTADRGPLAADGGVGARASGDGRSRSPAPGAGSSGGDAGDPDGAAGDQGVAR